MQQRRSIGQLCFWNKVTLKKRRHPDGQEETTTITQWPAVLWQIPKTERVLYRTEGTYVDNAFKKTFQKIPFVLGPKCFPGPSHLWGSSSPSFLISFFLSCAWFHFLCNSCLYCCPHTRNVSRQSVLLERGLGLKRHREADLWARLLLPLGSKLVWVGSSSQKLIRHIWLYLDIYLRVELEAEPVQRNNEANTWMCIVLRVNITPQAELKSPQPQG